MSSANKKGRMSRKKKIEPWYYVGPIQERCDGIPEL